MTAPNRVAVVTGAGQGIGRAIALAFASRGAMVALLGRSRDRLDQVRDQITASGGSARVVTCDVTSTVSVDDAFAEVRRECGAVQVLINCAGSAESAPLVKTDESLWDRTIAVNLTGTYRCTRVAVPDMLARGTGRVINVASIAARVGFRYTAAYCAAKHGVLGFTRAVALELARTGVTVNAICPGWVDTPMTHATVARIAALTGRSEHEARRVLEEMSPQSRLIRPEEVAAAALFLSSEEAGGITGQAIDVDGGEVMA